MIKRFNTVRTTVAALMATSLLLSEGAASASGRGSPFQAHFSGAAQITTATTTSFIGSGMATRTGRITTNGGADITGSDSSCPGGVANTNFETLTTPDGDTLTLSSQDVACPTGPGTYHGTGHWSITGGTGRFDGAIGQGSFDGSSDFNEGTFTITLTGTLTMQDG